MKKIFLHSMIALFLMCVGASQLAGQSASVWKKLALMKYERQFSESDGIGGSVNARRYTPILERMDGDEITISGYFIPLDGKSEQSNFMLSAFPYNMCFFCGNAGPESVVEVFTKAGEKVKYSEQTITLKGIFRFDAGDENGLMYTLENAVQIK